MISFNTSFQSKEFSCSIPDVVFSISYDRAEVTVTVTKSGDSVVAFKEYLYPDASGLIRVLDLDVLLEPYTAKWLVFGVTVKVVEELLVEGNDGNQTVTDSLERSLHTTVICCKANILNTTPTDFCNNHFLSLIEGVRESAPGWREFLCFIGSGSPSCRAWYDDGSSRTHSVRVLASGDYTMLDVSPDEYYVDGRRLMGYEITAGSRSQEYRVVYGLENDIAPVLLFLNSFGVQELAYCTGEHQQVSSFDRKQGRIGRLKESYKILETERFKADTGVLSFPMANWWREVFRSKDVRILPVVNGGVVLEEGIPVVLTSEKAELSNAADHLPRFSFEYEYADRNHNIWDMRREGRIFDNTFDYTFN